MSGGTEAGNAGLPASGFEFRSEGTTNGYAQVTFQVSSIMMLFNSASEIPKDAIKTIPDLKKIIDAASQNDHQSTNHSTTVIRFDGMDAVSNTRPISNAGPAKWYCSVTFFWPQNSAQPNRSIFSIYVTAENRATFDKLVASLKSVKIRKTPPPVKLAKEGMQLGFTQDEARKQCGEPLIVSGPNEYYITDQHVIYVDYAEASNSKIGLISYSKVRDPQKAAIAMRSNEPLDSQTLPMTKAEAEKILKRQTSNEKFIWSSASNDQWKRSDGAMAKLTGTDLTIATAGVWPNLHFQK